MAAISIRDLDDGVTRRLKVRAARHGRSMEAEARAILTAAVGGAEEDELNLAQALRRRCAEIGGVELELPRRHESPRAAEFPDVS